MITRSEKIKAGIFFIIGVTLIALFALFLTALEMRQEGEVFHSYFTDIFSLQPGAPVKYNGVPVGKVTDVSVPAPGRPEVRVEYLIEDPGLVTSNTFAQLVYITYISGQQAISLSPLDEKCADADIDSVRGHRIPACRSGATVAFESLVESVQRLNGLLEQNQARIGRLFENTDKVVQNVNALLAGSPTTDEVNKGSLISISRRLDAMMPRLQEATVQLTQTLQQARGTFQKTEKLFASVRSLSDEANAMVKKNSDNIGRAIENFSSTFNKLRATLDRNDERIDTITANVQQITTDLGGLSSDARKAWPVARISQDAKNWSDTLSQLTNLTRQARQLAKSLQGASHALDNVLRENRGTLNASLRNIVNATENMEQLSKKLRAQPSLLLSSPNPKKRRLK